MILAIGAVIVIIGRYRASEQERGWAAVRAQQAEAARRVLADPRQRKIQHDLWLQGQAYRKWEKEHMPGVILGPNPPEPPK